MKLMAGSFKVKTGNLIGNIVGDERVRNGRKRVESQSASGVY